MAKPLDMTDWKSNWRAFPWLDSEMARARWMYGIGLCYLLIGYLGTNEIAALNPWNRPSLPVAFSIDAALPFTPWMVIFYVMYYPLLGTPLFFARDALSLSQLAIAQAGLNTFSYVVFLLFPTPITRPPELLNDGFFYHLLDSLYRADHPYNTFPSLHVAQTCILAFYFVWYPAKCWSRTLKGFHVVSGFLVAASAVLIKQHYVADVIAGFLLAGFSALLMFRMGRKGQET